MSKSTVVPDGHSVTVYSAAIDPSVQLTGGGFLLAQLGVSGDEPIFEIEAWLDRIDELIESSPQRAIVSGAQGTVNALFAPENPPVVVVERAVILVMFAGSLNTALGDAETLQRVSHRLEAITTRAGAPPIVYLGQGAGEPTTLLLNVLRSLPIELRSPDEDGSVLVEVERPEGITICAPLGDKLEPSSADLDSSLRTLLQARRDAVAAHDPARMRSLDEKERSIYERWIAAQEEQSGPRAPMIARHLTRALMEFVTSRDSDTWTALNELLLHRDLPLFLMVDPTTRGMFLREWPGVGRGVPVYPDRLSLLWAADDLAKKAGSFGVAVIPVRDLFGWAASSGLALAINVYASRQQVTYIPWTPPQVKALADERVPIISFSR